MYNLAKKARDDMKAKARRLAGEKDMKVDSSDWTPAAPLNTAAKMDMPNKVAERTARKAGGRVKKDIGGIAEVLSPAYGLVRALQRGGKDQERDAAEQAKGMAMANAMRKDGGRTGKKDGGGNWIKDAVKKPGALHKTLGVKEGEKIPEKKLEKAEHSKNKLTAKRARLAETLKGMAKKDGGKVEERPARASGGRTKGKTNISINILAGQKPPVDGAAMPMSAPPMPNAAPVPTPAPVPAPAAPAPAMVIPPAMMQGSPMPMGRKSGGRVYRSYKDMDAGAASGDGRLEKTEIQKNKRA